MEPKHKRLGKKEKAPLLSFLPDYVEPPSGMVEAIRDELEEVATTPVGLAGTLSELTAMQGRRCYATPNKQLLALQCPCSSKGSQHQPTGAHSEPAHPSWRTFPDSSLTHRASIVCEQVPWRVAEEALRASPSGGVLHLPSLLHYPSSAPLMPLVLSERIDDRSVDRL